MDTLEMICCLKSCACRSLNSCDKRVEVKSALPRGGLYQFRDSFIVHWKKNGEAVFHQKCWDRLLYASQKRKQKFSKCDATSDEPLQIQMECEKEMICSASETAEMYDAKATIVEAAKKIANLLKSSNHCVIFTGAGISTSAGLGDFRGKGGKWTEQDREAITIQSASAPIPNAPGDDSIGESKKAKYNLRSVSSSKEASSEQQPEMDDDDDSVEEEIEYEALRPTYTHEAIQWLIESDYVKHLVSQNCDGLHILSGIPSSKISELHGNVFVERCEKCDARYERSFYVCDDVADIYLEELEDFGKTNVIPPKFMLKCRKCGLSHRTGRMCETKGCNGYLRDTIINFKDNLEEDIIDTAFSAAKSCDLLICLGTTLTVNPAAGVVDLIKRPHRMVICNRQSTKRDRVCLGRDKNGQQLGVRVYADCDILMKHVMSSMLGEAVKDFESNILAKKKKYDALRKSE
ncbi:NAD-dependent deacetylase sirtuin-6 [Plakobranchus ocellatus]|uniref:protein acetyllysine N-acetyltransferase n=1 Tax=Plakobranchus ocellatus TaxID=259542 RepID=A0AAV4BMP3_9GAST|nr:NAD-dependent deacetylase sirtuin-6 [Plakobranchus ocellatus]